MSTTRWEKGRSHDLRPSSIRRSLADERRGFFQVSRKKNAVQRLDFPGDKGIGQRLNGKASTTGYRHRYGLEEAKKTSDFNIDSIKYTKIRKHEPDGLTMDADTNLHFFGQRPAFFGQPMG
jgi:hypothetical protein